MLLGRKKERERGKSRNSLVAIKLFGKQRGQGGDESDYYYSDKRRRRRKRGGSNGRSQRQVKEEEDDPVTEGRGRRMELTGDTIRSGYCRVSE